MAWPARWALTLLLVVNVLGIGLFAVLYWIWPHVSTLAVHSNMTSLDRAEVIAYDRLHVWDKSYSPDRHQGLPDVRGRLARWIANRPLLAEKRNALAGLMICSINALVSGIGLFFSRERKAASFDVEGKR